MSLATNGQHAPTTDPKPPAGLRFVRAFADLPEIHWSRRDVVIRDHFTGAETFRQDGVEAPAAWSDQAVRITASKFFYGEAGSPERESSVRQLVSRVVDQITNWGGADGYFDSFESTEAFREDLRALCLHQYGSFNSPVWFNVGLASAYGIKGSRAGYRWEPGYETEHTTFAGEVVPCADDYEYPQASACFIQGVADDIPAIMDRATAEAMIFRRGSGSGTDNSAIRSRKEKLAGGGRPSGPLSFMRVYDAIGGVIQSGGRVRRAAKMETMKDRHPDFLDFIEAKPAEERKARALMAAGYSAEEAYASVRFQNSNFSVRLSDEFLRQAEAGDPQEWISHGVLGGDYPTGQTASAILDVIAGATHGCGDPGAQFEDTIQRWHTCPNTAPIHSSNPCSEYMFIDDSACNLFSINLLKFRCEDGTVDVAKFRAAIRIAIVAQDILVDHASYPTGKIAANSHRFRPLGLGYANLGALLMVMGLPYDSDAGRSVAGAITALMGGYAYQASAELAEALDPFEGFAANREPMLGVMDCHETAAHDGCSRSLSGRDNNRICRLWEVGYQAWVEASKQGRQVGFRNSQTTLLAPTGCVTGSTLVTTDRGLSRIANLGDPEGPRWQNLVAQVQTDEGPREANRFFVNGLAYVVDMETQQGYRVSATPEHRLKTVDPAGSWRWTRMAELREGDRLPMPIGGMVGRPIKVALKDGEELDPRATPVRFPATMNRDLAELVGIFQANGSLHQKGLRVSAHRDDLAVIGRVESLLRRCFGLEAATVAEADSLAVAIYANSTPLARWWSANELDKLRSGDKRGKGWTCRVPDAILASNDPLIYAAFLRGYADHDGTVCEGCPEVMNKDRPFVDDLKVMLLALGMPTTIRASIGGMSGKPVWRARLVNRSYCAAWNELIGFTEPRKEGAVIVADDGRNDTIPVPRDLLDELIPIGHCSRSAALLTFGRSRAISRRMARAIFRETGDPRLSHLLGFFYATVRTARLSDDQRPTFDLSVPTNVTYVANGLVSHNTIAFKMDCDTTGIEPELSLVKDKTLAGGGHLRIVNGMVGPALRALGYSRDERVVILEHVHERGTVEGEPYLKPEHLPVFDCALATTPGGRSIAWQGHLKMMAAVQPFLSGAISKTCNVPAEATVADIRDAYLLAWKLGLKAVAIFRDGSKGHQPLTAVGAKPADPEAPTVPVAAAAPAPHRERLPATRRSLTHKFDVQGHEGYATVGFYADGRPGELFITMAKEGSTVGGLMDAIGTAVSLGLQYGVPLGVFVDKFAHGRFEPAGFTPNPDIPMAKSLTDYIFRWLGMELIPGYREANAPRREEFPENVSPDPGPVATPLSVGTVATGNPTCPRCGGITERTGTCHRCTNCGDSLGCS